MIIRKRNKGTGDAYYLHNILDYIEEKNKEIVIDLNVVRNHALQLNRNGYVLLPHSRGLNELAESGQLTVEGWLYVNSSGNYTFPFIEKGWGVKVHPAGIYFYASKTGPSAATMVIPPKDKWFHLAVSYSKKNKLVKVYINGEFKKQVVYDRNMEVTWEPLYLGYSNRAFSQELAWGKVDEVRIWNKVLSDKKIKNNFKKIVSMLELGCLLYWRFDEGGGRVSEDFSGSNGILTGGVRWIKSDAPIDYLGTGWVR